ncbi:FCD domain-containing protein [Ralstonia sp. 24A2]|uniref:FCD domain-containing protein n=1 Tax=Ralstonia sp. 24A2 TaxID=3447364 RepID=UPI003F69E7B6
MDASHDVRRTLHRTPDPPCGPALRADLRSPRKARPLTLKAIAELRGQVERYERLQDTLLADTPSFQYEHENILQACRERNARGARSMTVAHLNSARAIVMRLVESD